MPGRRQNLANLRVPGFDSRYQEKSRKDSAKARNKVSFYSDIPCGGEKQGLQIRAYCSSPGEIKMPNQSGDDQDVAHLAARSPNRHQALGLVPQHIAWWSVPMMLTLTM